MLSHTPLPANEQIEDGVALVLAKPVLWACFEDCMLGKMPQEMRGRIKQAYALIRGTTMQEAENPIKKIPVVVTGLEAEVHIDNIEPLAEAGDGGGALQANNNNHGSYQEYLMALTITTTLLCK